VNLVQSSTRIVTAAVLAATPLPEVAAPPQATSGVAPASPGPALQTFELTPSTGSSPTFSAPLNASAGAPATGLAVSRRATRPFALVGVTWTDTRRRLDGTVEVRTRAASDGRWTGWRALDVDEPTAMEPGSTDAPSRGGTDPVWIGDSDGVEARVVAEPTRGGKPNATPDTQPTRSGKPNATPDTQPTRSGKPLPEGLRLDLINPEAGWPAAVEVARRPGEARRPGSPAGPVTARYQPRPAPSLVTRAGWGADESIVTHPSEYTTDIEVLFVHHTAGDNGYRCADSARIVRAIEAYHVRSKGWNDIGYNFLVDRCGTLFEGRRGGTGRAVLGAHTLGFNLHSAAIAVIGDYRDTAAPARVTTVIAQVAAYKLGMYGNLATGRTVLVSTGSDRYAAGARATLNRISGHRDTGRTECPGDTLYGQLPSIRALAAAGPAGFGLARLSGAVRVGPTYYTRGTIRALWSTSTPSGLMYRFDVFVDGRLVVSAPRANRTTLLSLGRGRHILTVRAVHLSGRVATTTTAVYTDTAAPSYPGYPSVRVRTGSLNGSVPVRLLWAAADRGGLRSVTMTRPRVVSLGTTAHTQAGRVRLGRPTTWTLQAADRTGNVRTASTTRTAAVLPEAAATRTGRWTALSNRAFLGGTAMYATAAGSSMTWTFTGSSAALGVSRTAAAGRVRVYVDGAYSGVLDLRSASTQNRQAVWARSWAASARHTVRFVVEGTTNRPGIVLDGLAYLR